MLYLVHKHTKEHHRYADALDWPDADCMVVEGDSDGWIPWHGGECPLPDKQPVELKFKTGDTTKSRISGAWAWAHDGNALPIIAYRPILDADTRAEPPFSRDLGINALAERPLWDGESWPPSEGARLEVREANDHSFMFATVRAIGMLKERTRIAVTTDCGKLLTYHGTHGKHGLMVRPIRSEEDGAVEEMVAAMEHAIESAGGGHVVAVSSQLEMGARALYRAGYRKTGGE